MSNIIKSNIIKLDSIDSFKIINPNIEKENEFTDANCDCVQFGLDLDPLADIQKDLELAECSINYQTNSTIIYTKLLDDIYDSIIDNTLLFGNKNSQISKPDIKYENRKTFWLNYGKNCSQINRSTNQLKKFIEKEMAVETSINDKQHLILRGKYNLNMIAGSYKKYIKNFVQCSSCKSLNTEIVRNSSNRLDYLKCLGTKCNTCTVVTKI